MYYFYCPNCKNENVVNRLPSGTIGNCRDGYGIAIHHYECNKCHNPDAGFMTIIDGGMDEKKYYKSIISMYQNIRGIKTDNGGINDE